MPLSWSMSYPFPAVMNSVRYYLLTYFVFIFVLLAVMFQMRTLKNVVSEMEVIKNLTVSNLLVTMCEIQAFLHNKFQSPVPVLV